MIERVRAVLITPSGQALLIRRTWPGATPYWVFPGGHVEAADPNLRRPPAGRAEIRSSVGRGVRCSAVVTARVADHDGDSARQDEDSRQERYSKWMLMMIILLELQPYLLPSRP